MLCAFSARADDDWIINLDFDSSNLANLGTAGGTGEKQQIAPDKYDFSDITALNYVSSEEGGKKAVQLPPGWGFSLGGSTLAQSLVENSLLRIESRFRLNANNEDYEGAGQISEKYIFDLVGDKQSEERGGISLRLRNNHGGDTNLELVLSDADDDPRTKNHLNKIVLAKGINTGDWIKINLTLDMQHLPAPPLLTASIQVGAGTPRLFQKSIVHVYRWDEVLGPARAGATTVLVGGTQAKVGQNDRIAGVLDVDYLKVTNDAPPKDPVEVAELVTSLQALTGHLLGSQVLSDAAQQPHVNDVEKYLAVFTQFHYVSDDSLNKAIDDYITAYEATQPPLFENRRKKIDIASLDGLSRVLFHLQQNILVSHFNDADVQEVSHLAYEARSVFPGLVQNPPRSDISQSQARSLVIDGTYDAYAATAPGSVAHRPTGFWAIAGREAEVCVSEDDAEDVRDGGVMVYVGAHRAFQSQKNTNRFHRIATEFSFDRQGGRCVTVANPFGGGIYVAIPEGSTLGALDVEVWGGVVASPYYDHRYRYGRRLAGTSATTSSQWNAMMSASTLAPWTDMESDSQLLTVPTIAAQQVNNPDQVMNTWDDMWETVTVATGRFAQEDGDLKRPRAMHIVVDSQAPCSCGGYPTHFPDYRALYSVTGGNDVLQVTNPLFHNMSKSKRLYVQQWFHEMGHGLRMPLVGQEHESSPDWFAMLMHHGRGLDIDEALKYSSRRNLDRLETAVLWLTRDEFYETSVSGGAMPGYLRKYSTRGNAKYADIQALFGWEVLGRVYNNFYDDWDVEDGVFAQYEAAGSVLYRRVSESDLIDAFIDVFKEDPGPRVNPLPLLEFWGVVPSANQILDTSGLRLSDAIKTRLEYYLSSLPADQAGFAPYLELAKSTLRSGGIAEAQEAYDDYSNVRVKIVERIEGIIERYYGTGSVGVPFVYKEDQLVASCGTTLPADSAEFDHTLIFCNQSGVTFEDFVFEVLADDEVILASTTTELADNQGTAMLIDNLADRAASLGLDDLELRARFGEEGSYSDWCRQELTPNAISIMKLTTTNSMVSCTTATNVLGL